MTKFTRVSLVAALSIAAAMPAFAQGAFESPAAPNSSESMPETPNSAPVAASTLPAGTTLVETADLFSKTAVPAAPSAPAPSASN